MSTINKKLTRHSVSKKGFIRKKRKACNQGSAAMCAKRKNKRKEVPYWDAGEVKGRGGYNQSSSCRDLLPTKHVRAPPTGPSASCSGEGLCRKYWHTYSWPLYGAGIDSQWTVTRWAASLWGSRVILSSFPLNADVMSTSYLPEMIKPTLSLPNTFFFWSLPKSCIAEAKSLCQNCPLVQWYGFTVLSGNVPVQSKVFSASRISLSYF